MKNPFRTRYRIVTDRYAGFEAQFRYWWMPFYLQVSGVNTHSSIERARDFIQRSRGQVVEVLN